jgi:hypothetical protein
LISSEANGTPNAENKTMPATIIHQGTCTCTWGDAEHLKHADEHDFCPVHDCTGCGYPKGMCGGDGGCEECDRHRRENLRERVEEQVKSLAVGLNLPESTIRSVFLRGWKP